jgi:hypothetical protein
MSDNVTQFRSREQETPHLSGQARCVACDHEWVAVAPVGSTWLQCPECGTNKGLLRFHCEPAEGGEMWTCGCGCDVFYITREDIRCFHCGGVQAFP